MKDRWHILGAGAIGNLWGSHLISAGFPVSLILRDQNKLERFNAGKGLRLGNSTYEAQAELADSSTPIKQLLITTKSTDTRSAFATIKHRLSRDARIIVLQNGMGSQQWVKAKVPSAEVAWASTTDGAWLESDFCVIHAGQGITKLGSPAQPFAWLNQLKQGFLTVEVDPDIETTLWRKLAINCAINPLTAIYRCKNGELVKNPDHLNEMVLICNEVEQVANALDINLFTTPLIEQACQVAELTANNYSSMLQDVKHNRITEVEQITGYLCAQAAKLNIPVKVNQFYLEQVKALHPTT